MTSTSKITAQLERKGSQGSKTAPCVACKGDIQPYVGRPVSLYSSRYAHHAGQCRDAESRLADLHQMAGQGELFAWSCRHVEPATGEPVVCQESGTDRSEYERHMATHGLRALKTATPIRLRRKPPAARLDKPIVNPFKWLTWTQDGQDRKGQYWSDGPDPQSVWVVPLQPAPWETPGKPARPVLLYGHGDGTWSMDWSRAKWDRREANRQAKRNAA
jgi:hypothetical protein